VQTDAATCHTTRAENERTTSEHYFKFQPSTATKHFADQITGGRGERPTRK
jgi:hypothetical protein